MSGGPIAECGDAVLYAEDVDTLRPGCWINDACIAYYVEHLLRAYSSASVRVSVLIPAVAFLLAASGASVDGGAFTDPRRSAVLVPVTDAAFAQDRAGAGSHWSLLVLTRDAAYHLDSADHANLPAATAFLAGGAASSSSPSTLTLQATLKAISSVQQTNGADCGVIVLAYIGVLLRAMDQTADHVVVADLLASSVVHDEARAAAKTLRRDFLRLLSGNP